MPLRQNSNVAARRIDSLVSAESRGRLPRVALRGGLAGTVVSVTGQPYSNVGVSARAIRSLRKVRRGGWRD
jgi:hypothetical protein